MAGLTGREKQLAGQLSGGWKQRLALGCAFIHRPKLLFLDEPTAGVDPVSRQDFWKLIYDLTREGITVFVTTHYLDEAEHANRIGMITDGILRAMAAAGRTQARVGRPPAQRHLRRPFRRNRRSGKAPDIHNVTLQGNDIHVRVDPADQIAEEITRLLRQAGFNVHDVRPLSPSLEDVFISLIETGASESNDPAPV